MSQVFGVPPPLYPPQQPVGVNGGTFFGQQYSPLGTLAAYKGKILLFYSFVNIEKRKENEIIYCFDRRFDLSCVHHRIFLIGRGRHCQDSLDSYRFTGS